MAENINLAEHLKKYFGFDTFKGNQEAIIRNLLVREGYICVNAYRRWKVVVLSVTFSVDGRNGYCYFSAHCSDEKSGRCYA